MCVHCCSLDDMTLPCMLHAARALHASQASAMQSRHVSRVATGACGMGNGALNRIYQGYCTS